MNMPADGRRRADDNVVFGADIVGEVSPGHDEIAPPDAGNKPAALGAGMDARMLSYLRVIADLHARLLPAILEILRAVMNRDEGEDPHPLAQDDAAVQHGGSFQHRVLADDNIGPDPAPRPDLHAVGEAGPGRDDSGGVDASGHGRQRRTGRLMRP